MVRGNPLKNLSIEELEQYEELDYAVRNASYHVMVTNNASTRAAYDKAIQDILWFETQHGLFDAAYKRLKKTGWPRI